MKTVTILSGTSGTGKTHIRTTNPSLMALPYVDIADVYREFPMLEWPDVFDIFLGRLRLALEQADEITVEGYFLPGSPSLRLLLDDLAVAGATPQVIYLWAPIEVCSERITRQWEDGEIDDDECRRRIFLLQKTWRGYH